MVSIEEIIEIGIRRAGGTNQLCRVCEISTATLWRLKTGKLKGKPWSRTLGKLTRFALSEPND